MITAPILLTLATLGAIDAAYLTYAHLFSADACGAGSGCSEVMASAYSTVLGIPLSTLGLGLYLAIAITAWRGLRPDDRDEAMRLAFILAIAGIIPTAYLMYLQGFVLGAWCPFCLVSAGLMTAILVVSARERAGLTANGLPAVSRELFPVAIALVLPALLYLPLADGVEARGSNTISPGAEVIARIGDRAITTAESDREIRLELNASRNKMRETWLDLELLETAAAERKMAAKDFVQKVVYAGLEITDEEVERRYEEIKDRLLPGTKKADILPQIRNEIGGRKSQEMLASYIKQLKQKYGTTFTPPPSERFALEPNPRGGPEKGSPVAPVTIIEFSDLECGYCARAHAQVRSLLESRGQDIRVVFRHLPLNMHKHARAAAEIAACVNEQGLFWPLADTLFADQKSLEQEQVMATAVTVGADRQQLDDCLASGRATRMVQADIDEAEAMGITSTPTFFINGDHIGSLPQDGLEALIDRELARLR